MKTSVIFTLLCSFYFFPGQAQHFFPKDSAEWKVALTVFDPPSIRKELVTHRYVSDTVLHNRSYRKMLINETTEYFLEADSVAKKVYILYDRWDTVTNRVLYDYSKTVGDTITVENYGNSNFTIDWFILKDSIMTINQKAFRYLDVGRSAGPSQIYKDRWIEGIGSIRHPSAPILEIPGSFEADFHLVCFTDRGSNFQYEPKIIPDTTFSCDSYLDAPAYSITDYSHVFPNPFKDYITLSNPTDHVIKLKIFTPTGEVKHQSILRAMDNVRLETQNWSKGLYILTLTDKVSLRSIKIIRN